MKRIWNALRYGDFETRKCIGSVLFFSVLAIALIIVAGVTNRFYLFILGLLSVVAAIMISQTFTLVENDFVAEIDENGKKDMVCAMTVKKTMSSGDSTGKEDSELRKEDMESDLRTPSGIDGIMSDEKGEHNDPNRYYYYNEQVMKKLRRKYHVRKDHRPIIVDESEVYHIKECPAFIWRAHNKVFLLLLEKEPRRISISRELIHHMDYVSNVPADKFKEYLSFKKESMVTRVFEEYLPDYFSVRERSTKLHYKNLYVIYPDIRISNRSAAQVLELLYLNFMPKDKITESEKLNGYFKRIYAAHLMYKDHVYSVSEYKEQVEKVLLELCYAEMPEREFQNTLDNLVKGNLISQKYADYYADRKSQIAGKS